MLPRLVLYSWSQVIFLPQPHEKLGFIGECHCAQLIPIIFINDKKQKHQSAGSGDMRMTGDLKF
jgi:hypothetical protein